MDKLDSNLDSGEPSNGFAERNIDFFYFLGMFFKYKYLITGITFIVGVVSIIYVLLATPYYLSVVTMYPVNKDDSGPLKQLAVSLGISNKTSGYYILDVLNSRRISSEIIYKKYKSEFYPDSVNLIQFWELDKLDVPESHVYEVALKMLSSAVTINEDKETALIDISVITKDKNLSKVIAESYCDATINYLNYEEQNSIKASIVFTKNRLVVVKGNLEGEQNALVSFQESNAKAGSPYLSMEVKKRYKNIELLQSVAVLLEKQLELLKIEEVKEKPIINILDKPKTRDKPVKPKKRMVVMINTFLSFFLVLASLVFHEKAIKYGIYDKFRKEIRK